jgi:2-polyprenyl-6-methoxyphenol hydroxylase-like FAD-dependent oxidoreductase
VAEVPGDAAFALYSRQRRRHLRHYQFMTRALTPFFQSSSRLHGWLRDWAFPIANALPPFRNHMIRTMAGVSLGLGRAQLRLELR